MATAQSKTDPIETATAKVTEFNEKAIENSKTAGAAYLDSYEKAITQITDGFEKAAGATKIEWLATVAATQADFTREITKAYTGAARELVAR